MCAVLFLKKATNLIHHSLAVETAKAIPAIKPCNRRLPVPGSR